MLVSNTRHSVFTDTVDGMITMSQSEWQQFVAATGAPYKPRSILEFNAMCGLAAARYLHENVEDMGGMHAVAVEAMKFGPNGEINFPLTSAQDEYMKKHGTFPSAEQLQEFLRESGAPGAVVTPLRPSAASAPRRSDAMPERKPLSAKHMREMRVIFSLIAAFLVAFGLFTAWDQHYTGNARYRGQVSFEGLLAVRLGISQILLGIAMLFPWWPKPKLAVAHFAVMLIAALCALFLPIGAASA